MQAITTVTFRNLIGTGGIGRTCFPVRSRVEFEEVLLQGGAVLASGESDFIVGYLDNSGVMHTFYYDSVTLRRIAFERHVDIHSVRHYLNRWWGKMDWNECAKPKPQKPYQAPPPPKQKSIQKSVEKLKAMRSAWSAVPANA